MTSTFERIKSVMVSGLCHPADKITEDADLIEGLKLDSLDRVEVAIALEEEFDIDIPFDASDDWTTMSDIMDAVKGSIAERTMRLGETV